MGEKRRTKSKGKTAKPSKRGLRPHEQRERQDAVKSVPASSDADRKNPRI
jgi:hypothetical protein